MNTARMFLILVILAAVGGCGVARATELRLSLMDNAPPPPNSYVIDKEVHPAVLFNTPTIRADYSTALPVAEVAEYYAKRLKCRLWWQERQELAKFDARLFYKRLDSELEIIIDRSEGSDTTRIKVRISTDHLWDRWCLGVGEVVMFYVMGGDHPETWKVLELF